jgi:hypothetical protein
MLDWPIDVPRFDTRIPSPNNRIEPNDETPPF